MAQESSRARPVQLHVIHDLGGGSAKWLADYCKADEARTNLVLRSFALDSAMGAGVALYAHPAAESPLRAWQFATRIPATVPEHPGYAAILREIIDAYGVQALLVSSVIGHSLEVLDTGLPTALVCHDYFPWCPSINLSCERGPEAECLEGKDDDSPFHDYDATARHAVRERFVDLVRRPHVRVVGPSESVGHNLRRLEPRFGALDVATIPHGYADPLPRVELGEFPPNDRLRVLVLGQLSVAKGLRLLRAALPRITDFADVYFLGCRETGEYFRYEPHVYVTSEYSLPELPGHLRAIRPHVAVLASVVAETFGYALSELFMMGVPVAASRVGALAERVREGEGGYLFDPDASSLVAALRAVDADRPWLARRRAALAGFRHRSAAGMVADYHRLLPVEARAPRIATAARALDPVEALGATTLASLWKQLRATHLQLTIAHESRQRSEMQRMADRRELEAHIAALRDNFEEARSELAQRDMQLQEVRRQLHDEEAKLNELYASTSWRMSRPVRWMGTTFPALRNALRGLLPGARRAPDRGAAVATSADEVRAAWQRYRDTFQREIGPRLAERVSRMSRRPLVSIVLPTYNTPEALLRETLDSVRGQAYSAWELCAADDGSSEPHVRRILDQYAAGDARIKVSHAEHNLGVSSASNRALAMATGEYVVLLDHDDVLEPQAILRVAEAIVADDPDVVYSDEVLVDPDGREVSRYVFRPAFSPEYLRSHPYIVHLVGFRTTLLRELGGWNEALAISQDYDLILRASEKARRIVHIPEILYRWRIHGGSSGQSRQGQVMDTSRGLLQSHLERTGVPGRVEEGASFNFFSVRYPLPADARVAIIVPTKNHGELLRQCIDSLRATIGRVAYDIVVVDHESDEPATLDYLASLARRATVLRYQGPFNFGAINNWAVAQLPPGHTHYLLCNNDVEAYEPGWLERMLELAQHGDVGIVGPTLFYPDRKTIQHAGVCIGMFRGAEHYGKFLRWPEDTSGVSRELLGMSREVAAVTAACMLVRRDAWEEAAGFDESIAVGYGDVDFCLRVLEAGRRVLFCAAARLVHHESFTRGTSEVDSHPEDTAAFRAKWKRLLEAGDPFYSPGLSLNSHRWDIRNPIPCQLDVRRRVVERDPLTGFSRVAFSPAI